MTPTPPESPDQGPEQRCTNHFSDGSKIFPNRDCCKEPGRVAPEPEQTPKASVESVCHICGTVNRSSPYCSAFHPNDALEQRIAELERELTIERGESAEGSKILQEQDEELVQLRATIETLTRECDGAKAHNEQLQSSYQSIQDTCVAKDQALEKCRAQLAASEKDRQWQPIETAPKDGTVVFICNEAAYPCSVEAAASHLGKWWHGESVEYDYEPTHWMPLPKAPDAAMKEAK